MSYATIAATFSRAALCVAVASPALAMPSAAHAEDASAPPLSVPVRAQVVMQSASALRSSLVLQLRDPDDSFRTVCVYPCEADLILGDYRVAGPGVRPSRVFKLGAMSDQVALSVSPATESRHILKWALMIGGGVAIFAGGTAAFTGGFEYSVHSYGPNDSPNGMAGNDAPAWAGWAVVTGLAVGVVGLVALLAGGAMDDTTTVTQSVGPTLGLPRLAAGPWRF